MKLSTPLRICVFGLFFINGLYVVLGAQLMSERSIFAKETQNMISKTIPGLNLSHKMIFNLTELRRLQLRETLLRSYFPINEYEQDKRALIQENNSIILMYGDLLESSEEKKILLNLEYQWSKYLTLSRQALSAFQNGDKEKSNDILLRGTLTSLRGFEDENERLMEINNQYILDFSRKVITNEARKLRFYYLSLLAIFTLQAIFAIVLLRQYNTNVKAINDANIDPLTGLFNRRKIISDWAQRRIPSDAVVIMADIDHFKKVNDTYGHDIGDFILLKIANILKEFGRNSDTIVRMGGEEFAIFATNTSIQEAYKVAEKIRTTVDETVFLHQTGLQIHITISFGISQRESGDNSLECVLGRADKMLYQSKHNGRNRTSF